jgi:hypothetical protein
MEFPAIAMRRKLRVPRLDTPGQRSIEPKYLVGEPHDEELGDDCGRDP